MAIPTPPFTPLLHASNDYFSATPGHYDGQDTGTTTTPEPQDSPLSQNVFEDVVAVIGIGYVGTHLAEAFGKAYKVIAYDINAKRCLEVQKELSYLRDVQCTNDPRRLSKANHFIIAVTTTLHHDKSVDSKWLQMAIQTVAKYARPFSTVVIESSVAVGMTRKLLGPVMAAKQLRGGMSPEVSNDGCHTIRRILMSH